MLFLYFARGGATLLQCTAGKLDATRPGLLLLWRHCNTDTHFQMIEAHRLQHVAETLRNERPVGHCHWHVVDGSHLKHVWNEHRANATSFSVLVHCPQIDTGRAHARIVLGYVGNPVHVVTQRG